MWTILPFIVLAIAFCWLAYQLWQGGKSNAALQTELRETRNALAETNRKNQELQVKLKETDSKLDSCTKALNDQ
jgi:septal ring factor EnvC (AmiA/AmiB activator)